MPKANPVGKMVTTWHALAPSWDTEGLFLVTAPLMPP